MLSLTGSQSAADGADRRHLLGPLPAPGMTGQMFCALVPGGAVVQGPWPLGNGRSQMARTSYAVVSGLGIPFCCGRRLVTA